MEGSVSGTQPVYRQIRDTLRREIEEGRYEVGERIPSERALAERFGVTRTTLRSALRGLIQEGLLRRQRGAGTFVQEPVRTNVLQEFHGLSQEMEAQGHRVRDRLLHFEIAPGSEDVRRHLALADAPEEERVVHIERLRLIDDRPAVLSRSYLPHGLCPLQRTQVEGGSLYRLLSGEFGLRLAAATHRISAVGAGNRAARALELAPGAPVLTLAGTTRLVNDRPVEYFRSVCRTDRIEFQAEAAVGGPAAPED